MNQQDELKVLFPAKNVVLTSGEEVTVKPFTFGQLPKVVALTTGLLGLIQEVASDTSNEDGTPDHAQTAIRLISRGGEDLIALLMFGLKKDREWFDALELDDGVSLTAEFLGVNYDFFTQRVLPAAKGAMEKFKKSTSSAKPSSN